MAVSNFTLAVDKNLSKEKKQQFEQQNKPTADFIRVVVFGKQAESCANYLDKGKKVAIQGSISVSTYKSNTGETRYSTDVHASQVEFIEWGDNRQGGSQQEKPQSNSQPAFDDDFANDFRTMDDTEDPIPF